MRMIALLLVRKTYLSFLDMPLMKLMAPHPEPRITMRGFFTLWGTCVSTCFDIPGAGTTLLP